MWNYPNIHFIKLNIGVFMTIKKMEIILIRLILATLLDST